MYIHAMVAFETMARTIASQCACLRARKASRALTNLYNEALKSAELEISQLSVLAAVGHFGDQGAPLGALADALALDRTTLTRNLAPLEIAGLLRVARSPTDARVKLVLLTRAGERAIEAAFPLWQQAQNEVSEQVGKARVVKLIEELEHLVTRVSADGARQATRRTPSTK